MTAATFSASLIVLVFSLMCLILVALYTSATSECGCPTALHAYCGHAEAVPQARRTLTPDGPLLTLQPPT